MELGRFPEQVPARKCPVNVRLTYAPCRQRKSPEPRFLRTDRRAAGRFPAFTVMSKSRPRRPRRRFVGPALKSLGGVIARALSSSFVVGLLLALYGLATHYVTGLRHYAPLRATGWFDVKSHLGNVFYGAAANAVDLVPNLFAGRFDAVVVNLTNLAGIRSDVYTRVLHAGADNLAETFVRTAPWWILALLTLRVVLSLRRHRAELGALKLGRRRSNSAPRFNRREDKRHNGPSLLLLLDRALSYGARTGLAAALFALLLLNSADYYQNLSGFTRFIGYLGSGLSTALDYLTVTGAAVFKELIWHVAFLFTDGKEKTIGLLTSEPVETLSHYLANFPKERIPAALHTAVYQAVGAGLLWGVAHALQRRLAHRYVRRYETLPPHMKRYLARRAR